MRNAAAMLAALGWLGAGTLGCPGDGGVAHGGGGGFSGVRLTNATEATICHVRVSRCDLAPPTTVDVLEGLGELAPGASVTVDVEAGCWNMKAEDCGLAFVSGMAGVAVGEDGVDVEFAP